METQQESAATPLNDACPTCNNPLEFDWTSSEKVCLHCIHNIQYKDDLILDLNEMASNFSLVQLGNYSAVPTSLASPINSSSLHSSPEVFLPKSLGDTSECPLHHSACLYWCYTCMMPACLMCTSQHHSMLTGHRTGPINEAQSLLMSQLQVEVQAVKKIHSDNKLLTGSHREFLCLVMDACTSLENLMREELSSLNKHGQGSNTMGNSLSEEDATQFLLNKVTFQLAGLSGPDEAAEMLRSLQAERIRLQTKQQQLAMQLTLNRVIGSSNQVLDLQTFRQAVQNLRYSGNRGPSTMELLQMPLTQPDHVALLANVCNARLYTKQLLASSLLTSTSPKNNSMSGVLSPTTSLHSSFPRFFLDLEVDGVLEGRVVLETRPDVAPKMAKNFASLCMGEKGFGYKGCQVFQCWGGESCIAGDFECNSGRGGRSIYAEEPFFMPDDSKLPCIRAAIGMRRTQKKHHSQGLVGSQFRILLRDMPFFTGVFGHVIHGLELVERVSFLGDHQGFPRKLITVANCGLLS